MRVCRDSIYTIIENEAIIFPLRTFRDILPSQTHKSYNHINQNMHPTTRNIEECAHHLQHVLHSMHSIRRNASTRCSRSMTHQHILFVLIFLCLAVRPANTENSVNLKRVDAAPNLMRTQIRPPFWSCDLNTRQIFNRFDLSLNGGESCEPPKRHNYESFESISFLRASSSDSELNDHRGWGIDERLAEAEYHSTNTIPRGPSRLRNPPKLSRCVERN